DKKGPATGETGPLGNCRTGRKRKREEGWGEGALRFEHWVSNPGGRIRGVEPWVDRHERPTGAAMGGVGGLGCAVPRRRATPKLRRCGPNGGARGVTWL